MAIRRCPYCKAIIDESQKYCNNCGTQLLFPEDEWNEEPVKGEKILDEDFKDESEDKESGTKEPEREDIDLAEVLENGGHFPDGVPAAIPAAGNDEKSVPKTPPPPGAGASRRSGRSRKKAESSPPKLNTKEEIARLIAALEEKEQKPVPAEPPASREPEDAGKKARADFAPAEEPQPEPAAAPERPYASPAWEEILEKHPPGEPSAEPGTRAFEAGSFPEVEERHVPQGPPSTAAGDTMDFEDEVFRRTPPPQAAETRMGIPETVGTHEPERLSRPAAAPDRSFEREIRFDETLEPIAADDAAVRGGAEEEPVPLRRLSFFRKIAALLFDLVFLGAIWLASMWLASRLMDVPLFDLIAIAKISAGLYFLSLLSGYFFLFLFFLGETLGDRMASPKDARA